MSKLSAGNSSVKSRGTLISIFDTTMTIRLIHDAEKKSPSLVEPESDALEAQKKKKKKDVRLWRGGIELL